MSAPETNPPELGGYRVLSELGRGGEGVVYLAESTDGLAKRVALKRFGAGARDRFEREREAYRRVEEVRSRTGSPHLVEGLAAGDLDDGGGFIALAYVEGGTLADLVKERGPLAPAEALEHLRGLLAGLGCLHAAGLWHRDVKPSNVLLGGDGRIRLGDFGLASDRGADVSTGGTPAFAAPEQLVVDHADGEREAARDGARIDVYGAAATLYYLLTGRSPLPGSPDVFLLEERAVPRPLQRILLAALAARPEERPPDAAALAAALDSSAAPGPAPEPAARSFPGPVDVVLMAMAALALVAAGLVLNHVVSLPPLEPEPAPTASATRPPPPPAPTGLQPELADPSPEPADPSPPPAGPRVAVRGGSVWLETAGAPPRELASFAPGAPVLAALLEDGGVVVAAPPTPDGDAPPALRFYDPAGDPTGEPLPLPGPAAHLLALPAGRAAVGTSDGLVLVGSPQGGVACVASFASEVLDLRWADGKLRAAGDDRAPVLLAEGEEPPPGSLVVEGALGRYAYPREPVPREVELELD